jgi:hypothetical protein
MRLKSVRLNKAQQKGLLALWRRSSQNLTFLEFRRTVMPEILSDCVLVPEWNGMTVGIASDGQTHT